MKAKLAEDGKEATTQRRMMMENGHPGVAVDEAAIRRGENPYTKYFHQQGEQQLASDNQVRQVSDHFHQLQPDCGSLNHYVSSNTSSLRPRSGDHCILSGGPACILLAKEMDYVNYVIM